MSTPNTLFTYPLGTDGRLGWAITVVEQRLRRLPAAAMTLNIQSQTNDLSMQRALAVPFWGFYPTEPVTKNKLVGKAHRLKVKKPTRLWMVTLPIYILLKGAHAAAACAGSSARTLAPRPHHPLNPPTRRAVTLAHTSLHWRTGHGHGHGHGHHRSELCCQLKPRKYSYS